MLGNPEAIKGQQRSDLLKFFVVFGVFIFFLAIIISGLQEIILLLGGNVIPSLKINEENVVETPKYILKVDYSDNGEPFRLMEGTCQPFDGSWVRLPLTEICINLGGFRGRELPIETREDTIRILVLGDSFTFGIGVNDEETIPSQLERMLNTKSKMRYEVLNFGIPGSNLDDQLKFLESTGLQYRPQKVIILFNTDDVFSWREIMPKVEKEILKKAKENISASITEIRSEMINLYAQNAYEEVEAMGVDDIIALLNESFGRVMGLSEDYGFTVAIIGFRTAGNQERALLQLADSYSFGFHPLHWDEDETMISSDPRYYLHPQDHHTTPYANAIIAQEIFDLGVVS